MAPVLQRDRPAGTWRSPPSSVPRSLIREDLLDGTPIVEVGWGDGVPAMFRKAPATCWPSYRNTEIKGTYHSYVMASLKTFV